MESVLSMMEPMFYIVSGDFRMYIGEDKKKVHNIVKANLPGFQKLYEPVLFDFLETRPGGRTMKKVITVNIH